jgi:ubiquinone/menaquinone biosynthesis C-methylase UbiE
MERTFSQIKEHYELEIILADKLRNTKKNERQKLYGSVYNELFSKIKHHPQLTQKISEEASKREIQKQLGFLKKFLRADTAFLEVGAGDCKLSFKVAEMVKKATAIDVSEEITKTADIPANFRLILSDGCSIPVSSGSIQVAYSNQLMEHLHEEDAFDQLKNIFNALGNNGCYVCITPNRLSGPHDISVFFDKTARGFHLKEYTHKELNKLFKSVGFSKTRSYIGFRNFYTSIPHFLIYPYEQFLEFLPYSLRKKLLKLQIFRFVLHIRLVGFKKEIVKSY